LSSYRKKGQDGHMPKVIKPLSDMKCRSAKPKDKPYALADGGGLRLFVSPDGSKSWRFDYTRPSGKRNSLSFGSYPAVTLEAARRERDTAKQQVANAVDPSDIRKCQSALKIDPPSASNFDPPQRVSLSRYSCF
jgi:Arm DNA-binding domain